MAIMGLRALGVNAFPYLGQLVAAADPVPLLHLPYTIDARAKPADRATAWAGDLGVPHGPARHAPPTCRSRTRARSPRC